MQLNKRKIDLVLRLTLSLFAILVCAFVLLSPYVLRTFESNAGIGVRMETNKAYAVYVCADGSTPTAGPGTTLVCTNGQEAVFQEFACPPGSTYTEGLFGIGASCLTPNGLEAEPINDEMGVVEYFTSGAFLISITGILLAYSGWILNSSIEYFIVGMGGLIGPGTAMGTAVTQAWTIIRDIINLTFVFGLIYLAFMTIARADTAKLKHGIANILIGALLINFSIFFGKAIIDIANVTAVEIYQQMSTLVLNPGSGGASGQQRINVGVAGFFADRLGVLGFIDPNAVAQQGGGQKVDSRIGKFGFGFSIFVSLIFLVASFVFLAGGILIAIRFIVLTLLLILSPIAFAFAFLPKIHTEEWSKMWWDKMVAQALFAPAYLLLLYIAMNVANATTLAATTVNPLNFFKGEGGDSVIAFMNFVLIIGFLVGAIIIAKKMGAYGASTAASWGKSARVYGQRTLLRGVGGATAGAAAVAGRRTFGRLGLKVSNSDSVKDAASRSGLMGIAARRTLGVSRAMEKASFDARQVAGAGAALGIGEGKTGGYKQTIDDVKKADEAYAKSLGTVDENDPRVKMFKQLQEESEHQLEREQDELKRQKELLKKKKNDPNTSAADLTAAEDAVNKQDEVVKKAKKAIDTAKENVEREKHRRQLGGAVSKGEIEELKTTNSDFNRVDTDLEQAKKDLKKSAKAASGATSKAIRDAELKNIKEAQEKIEKLEKEREGAITTALRGKNVGYAGVLESYTDDKHFISGTVSMVAAAAQGRSRSMYKAGAKAVREANKSKKKEEHKDDHKPKPASSPAPAAGGGGGGGGGHGGGGAHP